MPAATGKAYLGSVLHRTRGSQELAEARLFRVGAMGAPLSQVWMQLQLPSHSCGPGHSRVLGVPEVAPAPAGLEMPTPSAQLIPTLRAQ